MFLFRVFTSLFFLLLSIPSNGSVIQLTSGSFDSLRGSSLLNLQFDFSSLTVSGYPTLEEYIRFKKKKYEQTFPGAKGEDWYINWLNERESMTIPTISNGLTNKLKACRLSAKKNTDTKYTLIVKVMHYNDAKNKNTSTLTIAPGAGGGLNVGTYKGLTSMYEVKVFLVETAFPEKILATIRADYYNDLGELGSSIGNLICKLLK